MCIRCCESREAQASIISSSLWFFEMIGDGATQKAQQEHYFFIAHNN
jgi:hypothetical protein